MKRPVFQKSARKNNPLIDTEKRYRKHFDAMIPKIYAAMAISLGEYIRKVQPTATDDDIYYVIADIFNRSQELWAHEDEISGTGDWICQKAIDDFNIDVRYGLSQPVEDTNWHE